MRIRDDGGGFDLRQLTSKATTSLSGNGIENMKRRAIEIKGKFNIETTPGKGTTIELLFPVT